MAAAGEGDEDVDQEYRVNGFGRRDDICGNGDFFRSGVMNTMM